MAENNNNKALFSVKLKPEFCRGTLFSHWITTDDRTVQLDSGLLLQVFGLIQKGFLF